MILREDDDTVVFTLSHASAHFLTQLQNGKTLGESAQHTLTRVFPDDMTFDLQATLRLILLHPALSA